MQNIGIDQLNRMLLDSSALDLGPLVLNLGVGFIMSLALRWHFNRYGSTLTNREEFGTIFPMMVLTITLIISVVKASLALALGLVGALSIVRFRTPIKEPEELAYLFLAIGMGLALGAGQTQAAVVAGLVIMALAAWLKSSRKQSASNGLFLSLSWQPKGKPSEGSSWLKDLESSVIAGVKRCDLRRFDERDNHIEVLYFIDIMSTQALSELMSDLQEKFSGIQVSFLDQKNVSGF